MLIGANGEKMGLLPFSEALETARTATLDSIRKKVFLHPR
jgi:translation initiation factor IF-3